MTHTTATKAAGPPRTHTHSIWCLIDRSGSMSSIKDDIVGGFDTFFAGQTEDRNRTLVTVAQFDTQDPYEVIVNREPLDRVPSIRDAFTPRGGTPLFDAIGSLLDHAERVGGGEDRLVVILTDGQENASTRWDRATLFGRISVLRERGWTFVFIGANQDSYAMGAALGFGQGSVSNFAADSTGTRAAYESLGRATQDWRTKDPAARRRDEAEFFGQVKEAEDDLRRRHSSSARVSGARWWSSGVDCRNHGTAWCPVCRPAI